MRAPVSTYRLQLTPTFGFREAAAVVPYLRELGVTDLYLSPLFSAAPGSSHGYDVVDHATLRAELGGEEGYAELCAAAHAAGLGQLLDFVPNHMGIGPANPWWMDVLENGPSSIYAPYFDVDWTPVKHELEHKVLMPLLGDQFGEVLERGELKLSREGGTFWLNYWEHRFPIAPRQVPRLLGHRIGELTAELGAEDIELQELLSIVNALEKLAPRHEVDPEKVAERAREKEVAKRRLATLFEASPRIRQFVDENLRHFNGTPGEPRSFDLLETLLDNQAYRLAHWRVAGEEINYRRFFDINSLAAIRMEDERVFEDTHRFLFRLISEGKVTGLRIDHPDGLYTPSTYFRRLRQRHPGLFIVVEKILEGNERMPRDWSVDGTTGYEFLVHANGLFVDGANAVAFDELQARFLGERPLFTRLIYEKKMALMRSSMASEMNMLSRRLNRLSESNRRTRDFTLNALAKALIEYVARLPVYRTYVEGSKAEEIEGRDRQYIESTLALAKRASRELNRSIYDFLGDLLLLKSPTEESLEFVRKLQQVTGPVTAKATEDTAFYLYNRLVSLNEVGSDPRKFGTTVEEFHQLNLERLKHWPGSLNATSTHDTKRAEDTRLRISMLSEIPAEWETRLHRWAQLNQGEKGIYEGAAVPDANEELLLYQTLVGAFPDDGKMTPPFVERIQGYMQKALKEAKIHSSWTNVDEGYEAAMGKFVAAVLGSPAFLEDLRPFHRRIAAAARLSSLSQVALKTCAPGVADVYQGCELWETSLVDPDNRRPVDFALRARLLGGLRRRLAEGAEARLRLCREVSQPEALTDGRAKLLLLHCALSFRREDPELFALGEYLPLASDGPHAAHVVGFARRHAGRTALCIAPRLLLRLADAAAGPIRFDGRVLLPDGIAGPLEDIVTGCRLSPDNNRLDLADCFAAFPVAIVRDGLP